jgi:DNA topoisomerase-3
MMKIYANWWKKTDDLQREPILLKRFRRQYIVRNKKQVLPTPTGIQLIDTIQNDLVKSAELTGSWENS